MEKQTGPMEYDYHKKLTADEIIEARREVRKHIRERDAKIKEILESDK